MSSISKACHEFGLGETRKGRSLPHEESEKMNDSELLFDVWPRWAWPALNAVSFGITSEDTIPTAAEEVELVAAKFDVSELSEHAWVSWQAEVERRGPKASLWRVLLRYVWKELAIGLAFSVGLGLTQSVARQLAVHALVRLLHEKDDENNMKGESFGLSIAFALIVLVEGVCMVGMSQILIARLSARIMVVTTGMIERKSLVVSKADARRAELEEKSLVGCDVTRSFEELRTTSLMASTVVLIFGSSFVLWFVLGWPSLVGLGFMLLLGILIGILSAKIKSVEVELSNAGDARMQLLVQLIHCIHALKMMDMDEAFAAMVQEHRDLEVKRLRRFYNLVLLSTNIGRGSPILASTLSIVTLMLTAPERATLATIFVTLGSFMTLRPALVILPQQSAALMSIQAALCRVQRYLLLPEVEPIHELVPTTSPDEPALCVCVQDATFSWLSRSWDRHVRGSPSLSRKPFAHVPLSSGSDLEVGDSEDSTSFDKLDLDSNFQVQQPWVLKDLSFKVRRGGHLIAVVGSMASGKSSLLSALAGSLHLVSGVACVGPHVAFAPETPVIFSTSLEENIVMDNAFDEYRFLCALRATSLTKMVAHLPQGRASLLGERGQTISGGQAARVGIARALYADADLVLLDDPVRSVDAHVATEMVEHCILGATGRGSSPWANKSMIVALTQLHFLSLFDQVIVLKEGRIVQMDSFDNLRADKNGELNRLLLASQKVVDKSADQSNTTMEESPATPKGSTSHPSLVLTSREQELKLEENDQPKTKGSDHDVYKQEEASFEHDESHLVPVRMGNEHSAGRVYLVKVGKIHATLTLSLALVAYALMTGRDVFLSVWSNHVTSQVPGSWWESPAYPLLAVIGIASTSVFFIEIVSVYSVWSSAKASHKLHEEALAKITHAPSSWFESMTTGSIASRFGADLSVVDRHLTLLYEGGIQRGVQFLAYVVSVCALTPVLTPVLVVGLSLFIAEAIRRHRRAGPVREQVKEVLKPILCNVAETVDAQGIARCMKQQSFFLLRHNRYVSRYILVRRAVHVFDRFGMLVGTFLSSTWTLISVLVLAMPPQSGDFQKVAYTSLSVTYLAALSYSLNLLSTLIPVGASGLRALSHLLEFNSIEQEPSRRMARDDALMSSGWPSNGEIHFVNVSLVYIPGHPPAVSQVSFRVPPGYHLGICGRTGAGKSSILQLLFRLREPTGGRILIDGQDISNIGLSTLRRAMVIIPQRAVIFSGTLRENLLPFARSHDDPEKAMRDALEEAGLSLDHLDETHCEELSAGERQLISIARAFLLGVKGKIVALDEPTSTLSMAEDNKVQETLSRALRSSTVIMIAHRLRSLMSCDLVAVMDNGCISELGNPAELANTTTSAFHALLAVPSHT